MSDKSTPTPRTSRRDFITTTSAAAAASTLALQLGSARFAHGAGADDTIKIGVIGCGGRGNGATQQALSTDKGPVKLVAMGDAFADSIDRAYQAHAGKFGDKVDCPQERRFVGLDAYKKVLACDVDLVILATPPGYRPVHLEAAVAAGKHVFMEKPVAVDGPGVVRVLAATAEAKKKNLAIGVGLQRRHDVVYQETIKRLHDGAIGDIVCGRAYWTSNGVWDPRKTREQCSTDLEYQLRNWYYYNWLSGDQICEQHIHNIDVINWAKNAHPVKAQGQGGRQVRVDPKYGEIYDHTAVEFVYADGSRMFSYGRHIPGCWNSVTEAVHGTKGTAQIDRGEINVAGGAAWQYGKDEDGKNFRSRRNNAYQTEHDVMQAAIRSGTLHNEGEYGAHSTMTAILGRMAAYGGQEVSWEQGLNSTIVLGPADAVSFDTAPPVPTVAVPGHTKVV
jgi:myo-inositol 2-dehydrogenase/D-chiro-inositol 1-dehydrogenase